MYESLHLTNNELAERVNCYHIKTIIYTCQYNGVYITIYKCENEELETGRILELSTDTKREYFYSLSSRDNDLMSIMQNFDLADWVQLEIINICSSAS